MAKLTREEEAFQAMLEGRAVEPTPETNRLLKLAHALEGGRRDPERPSEAFRVALRNRIVAEAERAARVPMRDRAAAYVRRKNESWRQSFRVVVATGVAAAMLMGGGAVLAASADSKPGDLTHPVKLAREWMRLKVTRAPEPRGYLKLDLARERLAELEALADAGVAQEPLYTVTLLRMDGAALDATELLVRAFKDGAGTRPLDRLSQFAAAQRVGLESLLDRLPGGSRIDARRSIEILRRVGDRVRDILSGCDCPPNPLELPVGSVSAGAPTPAPAVSCACKPIRRRESTRATGGENEQPPPGPGPGGGGGEEPPPGVDLVPGTDVDEPVNDLVDQVLEDLGVTPPPPPPVPSSSPAPAPTATPSVAL